MGNGSNMSSNFSWSGISLAFLLLLAAVLIGNESTYAESAQRSFINKNSPFFRLYFFDRADFRSGYLYGFKRDESNGPGSFKLNHFYAKGELPIAFDNDVFMRIGGDYHLRNYNLDAVSGASTDDSSLNVHALSGRFGGGLFLNRNLLLTGILKPGIYSDFEGGLHSDDSSIYGDAELVYAINPGTQLVGGLAYDHVFESEAFYPLLGMRVMSEDGRLHLSVTVPREARIGYGINPRAEAYLLGTIDGEQFSVQPGSSRTSFALKEQERRLGAGLSYWLARNLNFEIEGGIFLKSDFRFKAKNAGQFGDDAESAPYLTMSFGLAL